jgi:hypothetical protein
MVSVSSSAENIFKELNRMAAKEHGGEEKNKPGRQPYQVRLPGFISDEDIGLGDVIKRATSAVGIKPCGGCERRAAALNQWFTFSGRRSK